MKSVSAASSKKSRIYIYVSHFLAERKPATKASRNNTPVQKRQRWDNIPMFEAIQIGEKLLKII